MANSDADGTVLAMRLAALIALMVMTSACGAASACPSPSPPVVDLDVERFYGDKAGSKIDAGKLASHDAAVAPLTAFLREVTQDADKALRRTSPKSQMDMAQCAMSWLTSWARAKALLGRMATPQAEYQRKWDFTGIALAYVKLKPFADADQRAVIEPWLVSLADRSRAFFDDPQRARNNHWYWLGLGLAAVGIGADSPRHWDMARGIMSDAARDIAANGTLPKEMERQSRALFYHAFTVMPLVVAAELGASRGEDWYALDDGALHRLVKATHDGLVQPEAFDRLAGIAQERPVNARAGWLQLYSARFPGRLATPHPTVAEGHRWIGGSAVVLKGALAR